MEWVSGSLILTYRFCPDKSGVMSCHDTWAPLKVADLSEWEKLTEHKVLNSGVAEQSCLNLVGVIFIFFV